jgi:ABC-type oligopeptide transport system ATPase subunit
MSDPLLAAEDVARLFAQRGGLFAARRVLRAVDGVSLGIGAGETVAVVGESGSGKSTLGRMLLGLLAPSSGSIRFRGAPLETLRGGAWREYRRAVQVVFQDSGAALNPRRRIGESVALPARWNLGLPRAAAAERAAALLEDVGLPPGTFFRRLPHELSGGQRQRVGIARALACDPALVVADEPVSALDVSVRAQVLRLFQRLQADRGLACMFITHDLGVVRQIARRTAVMRQGRIVELAETAALFAAPGHPYTAALLAAVPASMPGAMLDGGSGFARG